MRLKDLKNRKDVGALLNGMGLTGIGAEIGVAYGENATEILKKWAGAGLLLIDPWNRDKCGEYIDGSANIDFDGAFNHCLNLLSQFPGRSIVLRKTSDEAYEEIAPMSLDFVYIDGNHHDPQVSRDIERWYEKVIPGGIFGGHDYYDLDTPHYRCDVKSAVDKFVEENKLSLHTTTTDPLDQSWWVQKPA